MTVQLSSAWRGAAAGVVCAGLLIAAFSVGAAQAGAAPRGGAAAQLPATTPAPAGARITVTGTGQVSGVPNQLVLSMGVQTSGASVAAALRQANGAVQSITSVLTHSGVRPSSIQTSGLSIEPSYSGSGAPSGYGVSEELSVTLNSLSSAGSQISQAVRAGGNASTVDGVSLNLSDTGTLLASARAKAVADARAKAAAYARALGRTLGPVASMSESPPAEPFQPLPFERASAGAAAPATKVPVSPGTQQLSVTVTVVFALG